MFSDIFTFLLPVIGIPIALFFLMQLLFSYKLTESTIEILLFHHIAVLRIPYTDVVDIHRPPVLELLTRIFAWHCENKFYYNRVLIRRSRGMFPDVFLTPDDPDTFIAEVKSRVKVLKR